MKRRQAMKVGMTFAFIVLSAALATQAAGQGSYLDAFEPVLEILQASTK
jgi:hypothetical protein